MAKALDELVTQTLKAFEATSEQAAHTVQVFAKALEDGQQESRQVLESFALYVTRRNEALAELLQTQRPVSVHGNGGGEQKAKAVLDKLTQEDAGLVEEFGKYLHVLQERQVRFLKDLMEPSLKMIESGQRLAQTLTNYNASVYGAYQRMASQMLGWLTEQSATADSGQTRNSQED